MNQFLPKTGFGYDAAPSKAVNLGPKPTWMPAEPAPQAQVRPKGSDDTPMQRWAPTPRLRPAVKADPVFPIITASGEALFTERQLAVRLKMQAEADKHEGKLPTVFVKPDYTPKKKRQPRAAIVLHSLISALGQVTSQSLAEVTGRSLHSMSSELCRLERMGLVRRAGSQGRFVAYEAVK